MMSLSLQVANFRGVACFFMVAIQLFHRRIRYTLSMATVRLSATAWVSWWSVVIGWSLDFVELSSSSCCSWSCHAGSVCAAEAVQQQQQQAG
jgi:hypothetical protein